MSDLKQQVQTLVQHTPEELADIYVKLKGQRDLFDDSTAHQLCLVVADLSSVNYVLKGRGDKTLTVIVSGIVETLNKEIALINDRVTYSS